MSRVMFDCIASLRLVQRPLLANMRPVDSDDTLVRKSFQGFGKNEISRAFSLVEPHNSEVCPTVALLDRHHAVVLYPRLEVTVGSRFLPKRVDLWFTAFFDHLRKTCRLNFEELHGRMARPARRSRPTTKSARELRQEDQTTVAAFLPWRGL